MNLCLMCLLHFSNPCQSLSVKSLVGFNPRKSCAVFILSTVTLVIEQRYSWLEILNVGSFLSLDCEVGFGEANLLFRLVLVCFLGVIRSLNSAALAIFFLGRGIYCNTIKMPFCCTTFFHRVSQIIHIQEFCFDDRESNIRTSSRSSLHGIIKRNHIGNSVFLSELSCELSFIFFLHLLHF